MGPTGRHIEAWTRTDNNVNDHVNGTIISIVTPLDAGNMLVRSVPALQAHSNTYSAVRECRVQTTTG